MPKTSTSEMAVRKKMRKGTHSCFECRRRKIRCIFPPDNPDVCSECFARGSKCIDQEHASPDIIVDHRKNLRERVSRLEALVDSLLDERTERSSFDTSSTKTPSVVPRDALPPTPLSSDASSLNLPIPSGHPLPPSERGHHVPLLSVLEDALNDAEVRIKESLEQNPNTGGERYTIVCKNNDPIDDNASAIHQAKRERTKKALLEVLPPYDKLNKVLTSNDEWWQTWRKKCSGTAGNLSLAQFASRALSDGNIGAIGIVVLAVGICSDNGDVDRHIEAVDRYVLADDEYAATLEGMECLILLGKWYADVGQPRRAWLASRKGLLFAQLMGLHRKRTSSAAHESIWWALYHGDRFVSLLLGLPYGVVDAHCDLTFPDMGGQFLAPLVFMNKVAKIAGKVIDRNQGLVEHSFAWALQLDSELEDLWKKLDPSWLEITPLMVDIDVHAAEIRERVMAQMVYQMIRVYLHLPFMLKSQSSTRFGYSQKACLHGSREVLRLYQCLRTGGVQPLYECKAVDFIGFTSAVLVILGLFNYGAKDNTLATPQSKESDIRLIEMTIDIFRRASSEKGGKVALQSADVLEQMLRKLRRENSSLGAVDGGAHCDGFADFVIPYFGTISIRRGGKPELPDVKLRTASTNTSAARTASTSSTQYTPSSETDSLFTSTSSFTSPQTQTPSSQDPFNFNADTFISYDGIYNMNTTPGAGGLDNTQINEDGMNNYPLPTNNFSWQNVPMDIDQDWSWFLNDNQASSMPPPPTTTQAQQVDNQFIRGMYTGF